MPSVWRIDKSVRYYLQRVSNSVRNDATNAPLYESIAAAIAESPGYNVPRLIKSRKNDKY